MVLKPAVFLDRDGVIIENRPAYVRSWDDVSVFPSSITALAQLAASPYAVVIVTNQSPVGRGLITAAEADRINDRLVEILQSQGGRVDRVYLCPHTPEDRCDCRKPKPGLLLTAAQELSLDLSRSIMIGDALEDIRAGQSAGVSRTILVRTGRGMAQANLPAAQHLPPFDVCDSLLDAIQNILTLPPAAHG